MLKLSRSNERLQQDRLAACGSYATAVTEVKRAVITAWFRRDVRDDEGGSHDRGGPLGRGGGLCRLEEGGGITSRRWFSGQRR